jgi:hypothetical protein
MAEIYRHIRLDTNEVFYIGIGNKKNRAYHKHSRNRHWVNIVNKIPYEVQIIKSGLNWNDACELEKVLISWYGRKDLGLGPLVNMTDGGDGTLGLIPHNKGGIGFKHSKDSIDKMSGENNGFFGKKHTDEVKLKMSKLATGRKHSQITRDKMSNNRIGIPNTKIRKIVLDIETGIFYNSCKEASFIYSIKYTYLSGMLNGNFKNKTNLRYV